MYHEEVCAGETFHPRCQQGEILTAVSARYGRMELGRCVTRDFGQLGRHNDALSFVDRACSGRRECSIPVGPSNTALVEINEKCDKNLVAYLQVDYVCHEGKLIYCFFPANKLYTEYYSLYLYAKEISSCLI